MHEIRLQIPAHADYIDIVRICLYGIASKMSFSYEDIEDMKVAISEACNNAVLHGSQASENDTIDISFEVEEASLVMRIRNDGPAFIYADALNRAAPLQADEVSELPVGGLGIYLMQALMDEVDIQATEDGNEVVMVKYITN